MPSISSFYEWVSTYQYVIFDLEKRNQIQQTC